MPDATGDPPLYDAPPGTPDACPAPLGPGDGNHLLAVSLPGGTTYQFISILNEDECQGTLTLMATPLAVSDRTPVGSTYSATATYAADGTFVAFFDMVIIPAAANPTAALELTLDEVTLNGDLRSDRMCGTVTGMVVAPYSYDLAGSVWGALPAVLPLPAPDTSCP